MGLLALFLAAFIGGAVSPFLVKIGVLALPPLTFTALRFLLATIILFPIFYRQQSPKLPRKNTGLFFLKSVCFTLNVALFSIGLQFTTTIVSQILYTAIPVLVAILSYYMLSERFTRQKAIGFFIAFLGIALLLYQSIVTQAVMSYGTFLGNTLILGAIVSWAFYLVLSKKLGNVSVVSSSFYDFFVSTCLLLLCVPFELAIRPFSLSAFTPTIILSLLGLAILSSNGMILLLQYGIKKTTAFTASIFQYLGPFFTAVVAIPFLGEKPTFFLALGGLFIIFGVFYATTAAHIKGRIRMLQ